MASNAPKPADSAPSPLVIGIADTMFARGDMAKIAVQTIQSMPEFKGKNARRQIQLPRVTVPGFKDLPAAVCQLFDDYGADVVMAFGFAGSDPIDQICSHEASMGLMQCRVKYGKHVIEVFVHANEGENYLSVSRNSKPGQADKILAKIMHERARKHSLNAVKLLTDPAWLTKHAGTGQRQGWKNAKRIRL